MEKDRQPQRGGHEEQPRVDQQADALAAFPDHGAGDERSRDHGQQRDGQDKPLADAVDAVRRIFQHLGQEEEPAEQHEQRRRPREERRGEPAAVAPEDVRHGAEIGPEGLGLRLPARLADEKQQRQRGQETHRRERPEHRVPDDHGQQRARDGAQHLARAVGSLDEPLRAAFLRVLVQVARQGHGDGGGARGAHALQRPGRDHHAVGMPDGAEAGQNASSAVQEERRNHHALAAEPVGQVTGDGNDEAGRNGKQRDDEARLE